MPETKPAWQRRFTRYGIEPEQIHTEVLRARKIDQVLFSNPTNRAYGVTEDVILDAMEQLTQEEFGVFPLGRDRYIRVYETAMGTPPLLFAPWRDILGTSALLAGWRRVELSRNSLLLGAEHLTGALERLAAEPPIPPVVCAAADETTARHLQILLPMYRWCTVDDVLDRPYKYILTTGMGTERKKNYLTALKRGDDETLMHLVWQKKDVESIDDLPQDRPTLYSLYVTRRFGECIVGESGRDTKPGYAYLAYRSGQWKIRRQTEAVWRRYVLGETQDDTLGAVADFLPVQTATGDGFQLILTDVMNAPLAVVTDEVKPLRGNLRGPLREGDIIIVQSGNGYRAAYLTTDRKDVYVGVRTTVVRPHDASQGAVIYAFLQSEAGKEAVTELSGGTRATLTEETWARLPLPKSGNFAGRVLADYLAAERVMAQARQQWRLHLEQSYADRK